MIEIYFPQKGVRFIAVNDAVDSLVESSNDFNPIRNWANEPHAKDTSKKVRSIKKLQAERGEQSGGKIPYEYKRREFDCKEIIPDEETTPIVKASLTCALAERDQAKPQGFWKRNRCSLPPITTTRSMGKDMPAWTWTVRMD